MGKSYGRIPSAGCSDIPMPTEGQGALKNSGSSTGSISGTGEGAAPKKVNPFKMTNNMLPSPTEKQGSSGGARVDNVS